jgi:hypothetical protein
MNDPPKLPVYIARGYNILKGNPFTNIADPGFTSSIFKPTYNKGLTTEDQRFLLPDGVE